jgi:hypothetical protein
MFRVACNKWTNVFCVRSLSDEALLVESSWNVMARGDAREGKWRGNWRMEWVASTLHTALEHGVTSITTADAHTSAASSRLNWRPNWFKWTRPFRRKRKSGFSACAITFQTQSMKRCRRTQHGPALYGLRQTGRSETVDRVGVIQDSFFSNGWRNLLAKSTLQKYRLSYLEFCTT